MLCKEVSLASQPRDRLSFSSDNVSVDGKVVPLPQAHFVPSKKEKHQRLQQKQAIFEVRSDRSLLSPFPLCGQSVGLLTQRR